VLREAKTPIDPNSMVSTTGHITTSNSRCGLRFNTYACLVATAAIRQKLAGAPV
jgi:hypothetical protein